MMARPLTLILLALVFATKILGQTGATFSNGTYLNPILNTVGADPWVIQHTDGYYYMTYTTNDNVTILRSPILTDWNNADVKLAFKAPENESYTYDNWAPELHYFAEYDRWYIIYTADVDPDSPVPDQDMLCDFSCPAVNHRMFVLESSSNDPWTSTYSMKAELNTYDQFAIDGTYFQKDGKLYHIYSCWYTNSTSWPAMLCISEMENPWTVSSTLEQRIMISKPDNPWEKTPYGRSINVRLSTNEGPEQFTNPYTNQTFVIYSAGRSDNANYCLGLLELVAPYDPMSLDSWYKNNASCVFEQNPPDSFYGVGHASYVRSPGCPIDSTDTLCENFLVFHGMLDPITGWAARKISTIQFNWDPVTGWPVFPAPVYGPLEVPRGQVTIGS